MVAVAQTRGIAPSLLVSPTEAVRTGPPPRYRWILVGPSAAGLDYRCRPLQRPGFVQQPPWNSIATASLLSSTDAGARREPIARWRTPGSRRGCRGKLPANVSGGKRGRFR